MESNKPKNRRGIVGITFLFVFIGITYLSASLPFVPSEAFLNFLMYVAFPSGCVFLMYKGFKKGKASTPSVFRQELDKRTTIIKKVAYAAMFIVGIPFASALTLFLSQWYPAWPSQYIYTEQVNFEATIIDFSDLRKVNRTKIYLKDLQSGREFSVHWSKPDSRRLPTDAVVRLTGKQNWFGDYINNIELLND